MATSAVGAPRFRDQEHLRNVLGQAVADSMREIVQKSEQAQKSHDPMHGTWYPRGYTETFQATHGKWVDNLRDSGRLIYGWMPPTHFKQLDPTEKEKTSWTFTPREDRLPSECIKAAIVGLTIIGCGSVCHLARYRALLTVLGEEKFNKLFDQKGGVPINLDYEETRPEVQPMEYFVGFTNEAIQRSQLRPGMSANKARQDKKSIDKRIIQVGQTATFRGVPARKYSAKHPDGIAGEFNVVCMDATKGSQKYVGHGISSQGYSEKELAEMMIACYNAKPSPLCRTPSTEQKEVEAKLARLGTQRHAESKISAKNALKAVDGFDPTSIQSFRISLIFELVHMPAEEVSMDVVRKLFQKYLVCVLS